MNFGKFFCVKVGAIALRSCCFCCYFSGVFSDLCESPFCLWNEIGLSGMVKHLAICILAGSYLSFHIDFSLNSSVGVGLWMIFWVFCGLCSLLNAKNGSFEPWSASPSTSATLWRSVSKKSSRGIWMQSYGNQKASSKVSGDWESQRPSSWSPQEEDYPSWRPNARSGGSQRPLRTRPCLARYGECGQQAIIIYSEASTTRFWAKRDHSS